MSLPVKASYPGDLITDPEALEEWRHEVEIRLAALEAKASAPASTVNLKGSEGSLWYQMCKAAEESYGEPPVLCGEDGEAMIRVVATWINQWAHSNQIDTDRLMQALEAEAQAAKQAGIDAVKGG